MSTRFSFRPFRPLAALLLLGGLLSPLHAQDAFSIEVQLAVDATRTDPDKLRREDELRIEAALKRRLRLFTTTGEGSVRWEGPSAIRVRLPVERVTPAQLNAMVQSGNLEIRHLENIRTGQNPDGRYEVSTLNVFGGGKEQRMETRFLDLRTGRPLSVQEFLQQSPLLLSSADIAPDGANVVSSEGYTAVRVQFSAAGTRKLDNFMKKQGRFLAVALDGELITLTVTPGEPEKQQKRKRPKGAPKPPEEVTQLDILGGFHSMEEAAALAVVLNAGPLPVPLKVVNTRVVGE